MKVAIMYGGKSGEHDVSLVSASSVVKNIDKKHEIILIGITREGVWYKQDYETFSSIMIHEDETLSILEKDENLVFVQPGGGTENGLRTAKENISVDIVLPILHGTYGEDGLIQGLFEMAEIPYCGCGVMASSVAMDKEKTKQIWQQVGLPVVPYICVRASQNTSENLVHIIADVEKAFNYPVFVKPVCAGSSVGASKASHTEELLKTIQEAFLWDDKILIEPFIAAREVECSVTGNSVQSQGSTACYDVKAYTLGEIIPTHDFYDYDAKYTDPNGAALQIPAKVSDNQAKLLKELAVKAYSSLDCSGLSRVDFFIDKNNDEIYLNEINTIPGFTPISMFPMLCKESGITYKELIDLLLHQGICRFSNRQLISETLKRN